MTCTCRKILNTSSGAMELQENEPGTIYCPEHGTFGREKKKIEHWREEGCTCEFVFNQSTQWMTWVWDAQGTKDCPLESHE